MRIGGRTLVDFSSNDYLGLSRHPALREGAFRAIEKWGAGSGASRLMSGDLELHHELEDELARLLGSDATLVFGCGYLANVGIISALCSSGDAVFVDRFGHASMIDGILLSRARLHRFRHNDPGHLNELLSAHRGRACRALVIVESLYSMEGDMAPLNEIVGIAKRFGAMLLVDEAHAVGVLGERGRGLIPASLAKDVDIIVGTFGKAFGGYGAFAVTNEDMKAYLINRARTFIFSTALPPGIVGADLASVRLMESLEDRRKRVALLSARLRSSLYERSIPATGDAHIVSVIVGDAEKTVALSRHLEKEGFFVKPVRPPTVPAGTSRLRFSVTADQREEDIERLVDAVEYGLRSH
ncbi:MAG: 8-amino-7-oxononanoate synthase [Deltaproteobacteria bacterium]